MTSFLLSPNKNCRAKMVSSYTHTYKQLLLSFRMSSSWHHHINH